MAKPHLKRLLRVLMLRFGRMWRAGAYCDLQEIELRQRATHLAARLPALYFIFAVTALLIAATFFDGNSVGQSIIAPAIYIAICLIRARYWTRSAVLKRDIRTLRRDIERLEYVGPAIIVFAITWIVSLYPGATAFQQGVIHYVIAIMITSGILILIDTPRTAILGGLAAALPFCAVVLLVGDTGHFLIVLCQLAVTLLLVVIAVRYYEDLGHLLLSSKQLRERQAAIERNAAELEVLSSTDPLTGILNRRAILAVSEDQIADVNKTEPWLGLLDLDAFKQINDSYGHSVGDAVLQRVARCLSEEPKISHCGRIGGDEFAFLMPGENSEKQAVTIARRLVRSIAAPLYVGGIEIKPYASIGLRKTERLSLPECLERADFALFKAKDSDDGVALFDAKQEQELLFKNRVMADFRNADLDHELELEFQPIVDFDTGRILSVEALARWRRNPSSVITPDIFIELAESTGRIGEITDCVIRKAISMASEWPDQIDIQINLSPFDLTRVELPKRIKKLLDEKQLHASRVTFEITETTIMDSAPEVLRTIRKIRELGCKIALDDFGTGYSSLAYIDRFDFDQIKLDREFARKFAEQGASRAVVSTVFALSQHLRIDCTIEGIESHEQALIARSVGIRRMQGFHFARPMKQDALLELLRAAARNESKLRRAAVSL